MIDETLSHCHSHVFADLRRTSAAFRFEQQPPSSQLDITRHIRLVDVSVIKWNIRLRGSTRLCCLRNGQDHWDDDATIIRSVVQCVRRTTSCRDTLSNCMNRPTSGYRQQTSSSDWANDRNDEAEPSSTAETPLQNLFHSDMLRRSATYEVVVLKIAVAVQATRTSKSSLIGGTTLSTGAL